MGFTPQQVNAMSMWQFTAAFNGYIEANTPEDKQKLSTEEAEDLLDWVYEGINTETELVQQVYLWDESGPVLDREISFTVN